MACSYLNFLKIFLSFWNFRLQYYKNQSIRLNSWHHSYKKQIQIVWKQKSYLLIFSLELEIFGVAVKTIHQKVKNGCFCEELLSENDFEAVLVNFCRYNYSANTSEAVQKISTRILLELCQLIKTAIFIATHLKNIFSSSLPVIGDTSQVSVFFPDK